MSEMTLADLSKKMRAIDFAMLSTKNPTGEIASRPMSTNGDVEYDGDSFLFTYEHYHSVSEIEHDPKVGLTFTGSKGLLGAPPLFVSVEGHAELIRDRASFEQHWVPSLDRWFKQGLDTPGIVLIKVHAQRVHWWDGEEGGEIKV